MRRFRPRAEGEEAEMRRIKGKEKEECRICGYWEIASVHQPAYGEPLGSSPYGHKFSPRQAIRAARKKAGRKA